MPVVVATVAAALPLGAMAWLLPPRQQDRGIPITRRASLIAAASGTAVALALAAAGISAPIAVAAGLLANLAIVTFITDLHVFKIPTDTCWVTAALGAGTALWWWVSVDGDVALAPMLPALVLSGLLLATAFITWWFGLTGMGDVRLLVALGATSAWWLSLNSLLPAIIAMLVVTIAVAFLRRHSGSGLKAKVPAGPVYVTLYVVAGALTVAGALA